MRIRVFLHVMQSGPSPCIEGDFKMFTLGNDGLWLHLTNCSDNPPLQAFSMDHIHVIRPANEFPALPWIFK